MTPRSWKDALHLREIYTTRNGVKVCVLPGVKSAYDFRVVYTEPQKRTRTPRHVHMIVELYVKQAHDGPTTMRLRDYLLGVYDQLTPMASYPPALQVFQPGDDEQFRSLDAVGEFSVEFVLAVSELIFIQEKTNYPAGSMTQRLYQAFGVKDRFGVIAMATQTKFGGG